MTLQSKYVPIGESIANDAAFKIKLKQDNEAQRENREENHAK